ncbi:hypothetical protein [Gemmata sp.]|uniref:hypothetical protein n=1 Tax=Gemmata sp. TaxID=1914242 RepID=UPI003F6E8E1D
MPTRTATLALALAAAALLAAPTAATAQRRPPPEPQRPQVEIPADGTELFRALLDRAGVKPIKEQDAWTRPEEVIVVVLGSGWRHAPHGGAGGPITAHYVVANGGAALVATDSYLDLHDFNGDHRAAVAPDRVQCTVAGSVHAVPVAGGLEPEPKFDCPYLVPVAPPGGDRDDPEDPLTRVFAGDGGGAHPLTRVAANQSSFIVADPLNAMIRQPAARLPRGCVTVPSNRRRGDAAPPPVDVGGALFAAGGYGDTRRGEFPYRFLAMADQSVFINQMLIEPGTQNLELTYRVIEYLQGPTQRKRCLLYENGRVVEKFDDLRHAFAKPKPPLPMPNINAMQEKLVDMADKLVDDVQTRDVPNKLLLRAFSLASIARLALLGLTLYGTWFLLKRMFSARKPTDAPPPPTIAGVAAGPPGVFDRRQKELARRNNVYEPVRDAVREFFHALGARGGERPPEVVVTRAVRKPNSLRLAVADFWKLAFGPPQELSVARWKELEGYFDRVRQAHADGKWHFVLEPAAS